MSALNGRIIDVWMQHPTPRLASEPMFESLRRWVPSTKLAASVSVPLGATIEAMDEAGVRLGRVCAWWGPRGPLIDNDEVAAFIRERPDRLIGVASVAPALHQSRALPSLLCGNTSADERCHGERY